MNTITYSTLKSAAVEAFEACKALASSSRHGCVQARAAIKSAAKHGLSDRPYIVRDGMMYGWGGVAGGYRVEPLRGTRAPRGGARPGAGRKAADGVVGVKRYNVTLDDASVTALRALGDGDLSAGIRAAARAVSAAPNC